MLVYYMLMETTYNVSYHNKADDARGGGKCRSKALKYVRAP